jgi:hypothetical protein
MDFRSLSHYTRYPFGLVLPQNTTERVLTEELESLGVKIFRPHTLTSMKMNSQNVNVVDVSFDDGQIIQASYVVGADGARSAVCTDDFAIIAPYSIDIRIRSANWLELDLLIQMVTLKTTPTILLRWSLPTLRSLHISRMMGPEWG